MAKYRVKQIGRFYYPQIKIFGFFYVDLAETDGFVEISHYSEIYWCHSLEESKEVITRHKMYPSKTNPNRTIIHKID